MRCRLVLVAVALAASSPGVAMDVPPPAEYGRVVLDNFSSRAGVPPAAFDHWRHRARFTCRLCHVDVGFAMSARATRISATANRDRLYCGACHDGKTTFGGKVLFASCSGSRNVDEVPACRRCHARRDPAKLADDYERFAAALPRSGDGGPVDWEEAEARWLIRPADYLPGVSSRRAPLKLDKDVEIDSRASWMANALFSHRKHAVWNGCEVCHPDIFPSTRRGDAKYTMLDIANGQYCGACHVKVAFHFADCNRCHVQPER